MRQWRRWELTDEVLALASKTGFDAPVVPRGLVRYAIRCSGAEAARFIAEQRQAKPARVKQVEEWLEPEAGPAKP